MNSGNKLAGKYALPNRLAYSCLLRIDMLSAIVREKLAKAYLQFVLRCPIQYGVLPAPNRPLLGKEFASMPKKRKSATIIVLQSSAFV